MRATMEEIRGAVARVKQERNRAKRETVKQYRDTLRNRLTSESSTPTNKIMRLEFCDVGTRFEVLGAPQCNGVLLRVGEGSASVALRDGARTSISRNTVVRTLPRVQDAPTAATASGKSLPYRGVGLALWLLQHRWDKVAVRRLLDHYAVKLSDSSLRILQGAMAKRYVPADVSAEHAAEFEALR